MYDAIFMSMVQSIGDLGRQIRRFASRKLLTAQPIRERHAMDEVANDVKRVPFAPYFVNWDDVRVPQLRGRSGLSQKRFLLHLIELARPWNLDCDSSV